ncbi:putative DNA primase [Synechococcus phage S-CBWM1]|uniref:Putative DNA primase n=1 Tax=Synechococcus phage S-CBWM1 TaxID=2053653 RepID=A0A3G1L3V5_9CAUD|nr:DNA primase [Synechococcus phage S-CBWM1]ATW62820.1 putative DNA primase [Synechococcus phage S-CBWM1]
MPDPYSGVKGNQEIKVEQSVVERIKAEKERELQKKNKAGEKKKKELKPVRISERYQKGITALSLRGYIVELSDTGNHVGHKILAKKEPPKVEGIHYPADFLPYQEIDSDDEFDKIESIFMTEDDEVKNFWEPLYHPQSGDSELSCFMQRKLAMMRLKKAKDINAVLDYGHTFDPMGRIHDAKPSNPRIWVPDREWFSPELRKVTFADIFTIFPGPEQEILRLLLGRVGVGRTNHLPPGWDSPVNHTARMAAIVVGKDPGLGKSTLFNGFLNSLTKCGFTYHTFRSTEDRFGMQSPALADVAYKDDTSLQSLKKLISSEETKILITNGLLQTEEKFAKAEQIWPKAVLIVNANDWNQNFAYDIDPGIQDRIKLVSTYREVEVNKLRDNLPEDCMSYGSPDLRPRAHIPYLAEKCGVSEDAVYLWALRLATDRFWEVINDTSDPTINALQVDVRYWTSRMRIRFRSDVSQAMVNAMAFAWALRTGKDRIPELTPDLMVDALQHFYFVGVDPSCQPLYELLKENWEKVGRTSTHYYQGFREIRWESVKNAVEFQGGLGKFQANSTDQIKKVVELMVMRDGFKLGGGAQYIIENWENMRFSYGDLLNQAREVLNSQPDSIRARVTNVGAAAKDDWMEDPDYSPDTAELLRVQAFNSMGFNSPGKSS